MKITFYYLFIIILTASCSHRLANGVYYGTELISVQSDNRLWPGVFKPDTNIDKMGNHWYHEVTITVKNDSAKIWKRPFYITDGQKRYSSSLGGFYHYKGDVEYDKQDKTFNIFYSLDSCAFCPTSATGTPLYSYESYKIKKFKRKLIVKTNYEKGLIFQRQ